ncbi:hypothetical protein J8I29_21270 [Labrys sp. LIt4]|uniref:hypothetical protein n=1 Tax=Labrys sp. LIt4 TaxID=2821355 RepID=UPI001ADFA1D0|nr:hypothetical protein [Labrys sp. LIt4]MBP0581874.1 hypothetical protein [Labrys sp. LIt4]
MKRITVIFLWRKMNAPRYAYAFFRSIKEHDAGVAYDLVIAAKGYAPGELIAYADVLPSLPCSSIRIMHFPDERSPTAVIKDAAASCKTEFVLALTSWSRILAPHWLSHYLAAFDNIPDCGIVGASGGYECLNDHTPFPNVGIRSNAFMLRTEIFNSLDAGPLVTPFDGSNFEAGPNGMTKQIVARGLRPVVVDRFGGRWLPEDWPKSHTFRHAEQEGLLIADNRTIQYTCGSRRKRKRLVTRCWGANVDTVPGSPVRKTIEWLKWHYPRGPIDVFQDAWDLFVSTVCKMIGKSPTPPRKVFPG